MLADIFPTGYHATEMAGVQPGDQTVIYGAGPVGLMAALSATIRGASKVMVVDRHPDRLRLAESIGAIADRRLEGRSGARPSSTRPWGWARTTAASASATRRTSPTATSTPNLTMNRLVASVRFTGRIGIVGVFVPQDPGGQRRAGEAGQARLRLRHVLVQGPAHRQRPGAGQEVQPAAARPHRRAARPSRPSSSATSCRWTQAPEAYEHFDNRDDGWTKVVLHPAMRGERLTWLAN